MIELVESHVVYENPKPMLRSRHGYFPGVVELPSGELLALLVIGEAFESVDLATHVARSGDLGRTWELQGPLYDKSGDGRADQRLPQAASCCATERCIALGYRFHRDDPEQPIAIEATDGALPGDDVVSFSSDDGRTWTVPRVIPRSTPELLETPEPGHPARVRATSSRRPACSRCPTAPIPAASSARSLRSTDDGRTWDDRVRYFDTPGPHRGRLRIPSAARCSPAESSRSAGRSRSATGRYLHNQVTVSHDDGHTWSAPIDTGHPGRVGEPAVPGRGAAAEHPQPPRARTSGLRPAGRLQR